MTLLDRIKVNNKETKEIQDLLESFESYYDTSYEEMYEYYRAMKQKSAEKFSSERFKKEFSDFVTQKGEEKQNARTS